MGKLICEHCCRHQETILAKDKIITEKDQIIAEKNDIIGQLKGLVAMVEGQSIEGKGIKNARDAILDEIRFACGELYVSPALSKHSGPVASMVGSMIIITEKLGEIARGINEKDYHSVDSELLRICAVCVKFISKLRAMEA